jgi:tripartite-type tricarboxylate transporter receptor subunit TctC
MVSSALLFTAHPASAQECAGTTKIVVGQAAGGGADTVARLLAQRLQDRLGRTVIVENRSGAGNNIAAEYVARAPKDGCTLLLRGSDHVVNTMIYDRPGYQLKDFTPIGRLVYGPLVIVANARQSLQTIAAIVADAKKNPGKLSYASTSAGSGAHVPMEMFLHVAGIKVVHVPYKGAAPAMTDVAGGSVPIGIGSVTSALPLIQAGKLIPLVVLGHDRWAALPEVPTLAEAGYAAANMPAWLGLFAPSGTPAAAVDRLNNEVQAVLADPAVRDRLVVQGWAAAPSGTRDFVSLLQEEERSHRSLMTALKLKVE